MQNPQGVGEGVHKPVHVDGCLLIRQWIHDSYLEVVILRHGQKGPRTLREWNLHEFIARKRGINLVFDLSNVRY